MNLIPNAVSLKFGRTVLLAQKHSPRIMFVAGIAGVVGTVILASRATLKLNDVLDDAEHEIKGVKTELKHRDGQYQKDLAYVYSKNALIVTKLYAPSVLLGVTSIGLLTGSHVTLTRRNTALTAAYAAVAKAYDDYRVRVREELGPDREASLYHSTTLQKIIDENGKKVELTVGDPNKHSPYARFFDEYSTQWVKNAELNRIFIQCQQNWLNQMLHARGHVFLNEAYDALGLPRSAAGQVVGWLLDSESSDNYIDFGIFDIANSRFLHGAERSILLDFNVDDRPIFDQI